MTESYTYNGTDLRIIRAGTVELTEHADHGEIGTGRFTIDDEAGTYDIVGHKSFTAEQSACAVVRTFTGYIGSREYQRNIEKVGAARTIDVSTLDLNARLGFKIIRGRSWNRPRETIGERMTALLASSFLSGLVADYGFVDYPTDEMDKNDYRGQFPLDVIRDCALPVGYNYFVYWSEADAAAGLWFRDSNTSTAFSSTLRLSNVASDIDDSTTFAVGQDTTLERDPSQVISGVLVPFTKGNVYRTRSATASNFQARDGMAPNSQIKKRAKAVTLGDHFLFERRNEEDVIRTTMLAVPSNSVNLVRAGQRIEAKFSHFATEGYGSFSWFRILEATKKPINAEGALYDIPLTLSPQEGGCSVQPTLVQSNYQDSVSAGGNFTNRFSLDSAAGNGTLLVLGTISGAGTGDCISAPTGSTWLIQNMNIDAGGSSFIVNVFSKRAAGESYLDVEFASPTPPRGAIAEWSGPTNPVLSGSVVTQRDFNLGYATVGTIPYPDGPSLVLAIGGFQHGPGSGDALFASGTGMTLVYAIDTAPGGEHASLSNPALGMGQLLRDGASGSVTDWAFGNTDLGFTLTLGLVFVGENC